MSSQDALAAKSIRASTRKTLLSPRRQSSSSTGSACNTPTKQDPETTKAPSATASPNTTRTSSRRRAHGRTAIPEDASYLSPPQKRPRISDTTTATTTSSTSSSSRSSRRKRRTEPLLSMPIEPRGNAQDDDLPPANQGPWTDEERIRLEVALKTEPDMRAVVRYVRTRRMPAVRSFAPRNFPELYQQLRDRMEGSTNNNNDKDDDKDEE